MAISDEPQKQEQPRSASPNSQQPLNGETTTTTTNTTTASTIVSQSTTTTATTTTTNQNKSSNANQNPKNEANSVPEGKIYFPPTSQIRCFHSNLIFLVHRLLFADFFQKKKNNEQKLNKKLLPSRLSTQTARCP